MIEFLAHPPLWFPVLVGVVSLLTMVWVLRSAGNDDRALAGRREQIASAAAARQAQIDAAFAGRPVEVVDPVMTRAKAKVESAIAARRS